MDINLNNVVSASEVQRNYRKVFDRAKKTREPIIVLRDNKPDVAVVDIKVLEKLNKRLEELEIEDTLRVIRKGDRELASGKTKTFKSLAELL